MTQVNGRSHNTRHEGFDRKVTTPDSRVRKNATADGGHHDMITDSCGHQNTRSDVLTAGSQNADDDDHNNRSLQSKDLTAKAAWP